ncbi:MULTISPECIES: MerR family transcriptional regulator [Streptomyces]|uniref:MerR family transcriptional regulator n=1 Tax=Streptomyces TaxID=1883 RepID=UPI001672E02F|nr:MULTISPECIES: MerR family transcriptional regulator [Streptomyces]MBD3575738.1 MerR family transcriptional regulator [Streptomyces sp. KD18]GGT25677.1 transcriptional regulator [Streptomyces toxytricini]
MKISELSRRTGVPVASIKYFRREGLLPAGRATAATLAEYGDEHVQRLRLIKALTALGGLSIAATREVLAALDRADTIDGTLGAISYALPVPVAESPAADAGEDARAAAAADADVAELVAAMDWQVSDVSPHVRGLATAVKELRRLDPHYRPDRLVAYAGLARDIARLDLERAAAIDDPAALAEQAVIVFALSAPVLELLRRLAQEDLVRRRIARDAAADGADGAPEPAAGGAAAP